MKTKILLGLTLAFLAQPLFADDSTSGPGGTFISQFLNEGSTLTRRSKVNWTGAGVDCVDNSGLKRTDCTVSATATSGPAPAFAVNNNGVLVSSPTSTINMMAPLRVALQGSTTAQVTLEKISLSTAVTGTLDISTQTNLAVTNPIILTGDTLSLSLISLSTGIVGPLLISSGTITQFYSSTITFADGTQQYTAAPAAAGDITSVTAGTGLTGGGLSGGVTLNVDPTYTGFIWNTGSLQTGATAYPQFLNVGTSGALVHGILNVDGIITASNTAITTAAGLLDATKITGTIPNASLDNSSVTKMGNVFNGASQLVQLDASADVPDANLSANVSLLGSSIDISAETNLSAQYPLAMSGDTVIVSTGGLLISTSSLQSGATFYVSSGTVQGQLVVNQTTNNSVAAKFYSPTTVGNETKAIEIYNTGNGGFSSSGGGIGFYMRNDATGNSETSKIYDVGSAFSAGSESGWLHFHVKSNGSFPAYPQLRIKGSSFGDRIEISATACLAPASGTTINLWNGDSGTLNLTWSHSTANGTLRYDGSTFGFSKKLTVDDTATLSKGLTTSSGTFTSSASFSGATVYLATSPAVFAVSKNDYNVGFSPVVRSSASTAVNITGFANGFDGSQFEFVNVGTTTITLQNENASSSAANRIITTTGSDDPVTTKGSRRLWYDTITSRWRIIQ